MFEFKTISSQAIPAALAKAERYRLLNEPREAESICHDVLAVDPNNRQALVTMLLALTDQFGADAEVDLQEARDVLARLRDEYERAYYAGVICERWGKGRLVRGAPEYAADDWLRQAMGHYEQAESLSPPNNDDAVLRWNACARTLMRHQHGQPSSADIGTESGFDDEVPQL